MTPTLLYALLLPSLATAVWKSTSRSSGLLAEKPRVPQAFLLGGQKCGSTSLFKNLEEWPKSDMCPGKSLAGEPGFYRKEKHFFDHATPEKLRDGIAHYSAHFDVCPTDSLLMDGTPNYLCDTSTPKLLKTFYEVELGINSSAIKFVAVLRNPIFRAMSEYEHGVRSHWANFENKTWEAIVDEGIKSFSTKKVAAESSASLSSKVLPETTCKALEGGLYSLQLRHWLQHFKPEQFLIVSFQQLLFEPGVTMGAVAKHLGLPHRDFSQTFNANSGQYKQPVVSQRVVDFFKEHNDDLTLLRKEYPQCFLDTPGSRFRFIEDPKVF